LDRTAERAGFLSFHPMSALGSKISVGLVEDDVPYRFYISMLLSSSERFSVAFACDSISAAITAMRQSAPRLLLLDLRLPGVVGATGLEQLVQISPSVQVLMLTSVDREDALLDCIKAGAAGYLLKGISSEDLLRGLDEALAGGAPMSPSIARRMIGLLRAPVSGARPDVPPEPRSELTPRELDVLQAVAQGLSDKEVAQKLGTAVSTVKNQLASIYVKWRVRSRTEAVVRLLQQGP
jgi:DNA-binding NarL/FixJ family response regulator